MYCGSIISARGRSGRILIRRPVRNLSRSGKRGGFPYRGTGLLGRTLVAEGNSLPHLIQVTVGFRSITQHELEDEDLVEYPIDNPDFALGDDLPHSDRYSILIKIVAADKLFSSRIQRVGQQMAEGLGIGGLGP